MTKAAVYVGTRNLYGDMLPAVKSLLYNSDVDIIYLLIEDDRFPFDLPECVRTINVSDQPWISPYGPNVNRKWTWMTLMRACLTKILPDHDLVLSLDDDVIAVGDVSGIWDLPIGDNYFAAAREPLKSKGGRTYVCDYYGQMGVALQNLRQLRKDYIDDRIIADLNARENQFVEQTAFNRLCQGRIYEMPSEYNACPYTLPCDKPRMIHYAAIPVQRWRDMPEVARYREMTFEEAMRGNNERHTVRG